MLSTSSRKLLAGLLVTLASVGLTAVSGLPAVGQDNADDLRQRNRAAQAQLDELRERLEGTGEALTAAYLQLEEANAKVPEMEQAVKDAQRTYSQATQEYDAISDALAQAQAQRDQVTAEVNQDKELTQGSKATLGLAAREAMTGGVMASPELAVISGSSSFNQAVEDFAAVQMMSRWASMTVERAQQSLAQGRNAQERLTLVSNKTEQLAQQAKVALDRATAAKLAADKAKTDLDAQVASLGQLTANLEAAKARDLEDQAKVAAEQATLQAKLNEIVAKEGGAGAGPAPTSGFFGAPLSRMSVSSPFGWRIHPIYGTSKLHAGVDLSAGCGTPIYASASGTVVQSAFTSGYGNRVVVNHGNVEGAVMMSTYNHQESLAVHEGQAVTKGEVIGRVGTTGASTGCHLHFEIQVNGQVVDPMPYLR